MVSCSKGKMNWFREIHNETEECGRILSLQISGQPLNYSTFAIIHLLYSRS